MQVQKVMKLPDLAACSKEVGLPNTLYPSDHLRIEAEMSIIPQIASHQHHDL